MANAPCGAVASKRLAHVGLVFLLCLQLLFDVDKEIFPMVVQAVVDEGEGEFNTFNVGTVRRETITAAVSNLCRTSGAFSHPAGDI